MRHQIDRTLIAREAISTRVAELATQIVADHSASGAPDGPDITIVPILTGAMVFCGDLIRHMPIAMRIGLLTVSSYPGRTTQSQGPRTLAEQIGDVRGRHVLLVDDILDSGKTLSSVTPMLREMSPLSLRTCVLLRKNRPSARQVHVDYVGFDIPDVFVVGYGLDFDDYYRNLPDIVTLKAEVLADR